MPQLFDKIIDKPIAYRRRLAYGLTGIIGCFIFFVWVVITGESLKQSAKNTEKENRPTMAQQYKKNLPVLNNENLKAQIVNEDGTPIESPSPDSESFETLLEKQQEEQRIKER